MKKSTAIVIFIIYVVSIIVIGFMGMKAKVYDVQKYITEIEMDASAEDKEMFTFEYKGIHEKTQYNWYELRINFDKAIVDKFEVDGMWMDRKYIPITLLPKVSYTSGEVGKGETIKYWLSRPELQESGSVDLQGNGVLKCFRETSFYIKVYPESITYANVGAYIDVYIY